MDTREMPERPLSKPFYEALPYLYIVGGAAGAGGSYLLAGKVISDVLLVAGIVCVLGGLVVLLRRRGYRVTRAEYPGSPLDRR